MPFVIMSAVPADQVLRHCHRYPHYCYHPLGGSIHKLHAHHLSVMDFLPIQQQWTIHPGQLRGVPHHPEAGHRNWICLCSYEIHKPFHLQVRLISSFFISFPALYLEVSQPCLHRGHAILSKCKCQIVRKKLM